MSETDSKKLLYKQYKLQFSVRSDVGKQRTENQDYYAYSKTGKSQLFVVADGMGGASGGQIASSTACHVIARNAFALDGKITEESITEAFEKANQVIYCLGANQPEFAGMGTTVVALGFNGEDYLIAYIGDSRIYRLRGKEFLQISKDHTVIQELLEKGELSQEEAKNSPISNVLTKCIGPNYTMKEGFVVKINKVQPGDIFLLCSDGLCGVMDNDTEMKDILSSMSLDLAVEKLINLANAHSGSDNITALVVKVDEAFNEELPRLLNWKVVDFIFPKHGLTLDLDFNNIDKVLQKLTYSLPSAEVLIKKEELDANKTKEQNSCYAGDNKLENLKFPPATEQAEPAAANAQPTVQELEAKVEQIVNAQGEKYNGSESKEYRFISFLISFLVLLFIIIPAGWLVIRNQHQEDFNAQQNKILDDIRTQVDEQADNELLVATKLELENEPKNDQDFKLAKIEEELKQSFSLTVSNSEQSYPSLINRIRKISKLVEKNLQASRNLVAVSKKPREDIEAEKREIRELKIKLRNEIILLDKNLGLLEATSQAEVDKLKDKVFERLEWVANASVVIEEKIATTKEELNFLSKNRKNLLALGLDGIDLENTVLAQSRVISQLAAEYKKAIVEYQNAVAAWVNDSKNAAFANEMTVSGIKVNRLERTLKEITLEHLNAMLEAKKTKLVALVLLQIDLGLYREVLEQEKGLNETFKIVISAQAKDTATDKLLEQRITAEKKYQKLEVKLPLTAELKLNKSEAIVEIEKL
ncbi:MAG: protein phosphatase 2C domain-containing protein [Deltaproteobacteria bacterium]|jgi:protein phosphatase|nr:protein phosphatase 2C domain-containing protein [Deltaproteobacteria bacterium]